MASDLVIEFGDVLETPTLAPGQAGQVQVVVTNQGDQAVIEPFDISLYASTDVELDDDPLNVIEPGFPNDQILRGTDELLGTQTINDDFNPGQSRTFTIDFASNEFANPSVVSPGAYFLIAEADSDEPESIVESNEGNNENSQFISADGADVVLVWNSTLLNAIQAEGERLRGSMELPISSPPFAARNAAIVHTAIYEAFLEASDTAGASQEAAVVGAAHQALSELYPEQQAVFDEQLDRSLEEIGATTETLGYDIGVRNASELVAERQNDGSADAQVDFPDGDEVGEWRRTPTIGNTAGPESNFAPALLPEWGEIDPFAIPSVEEVVPDRVDGPPETGERRYGIALSLVKNFGSLDSNVRTDGLTEIAYFWAYDRPDTFGPPGQWNEISQEIALQQENTLGENARLFALLNTAMADAGIVTWDLKYEFNQWRPITAIREASTDDNRIPTEDPNWEPLLDTPPFPDYISGHAAFGAAAGTILRNFYGTNNISFDIPSQDLPGEVRSYNTIRQAVRENALSRVVGGIHVGPASIDGVLTGAAVSEAVGDAVGDAVFNNFDATIVS